MYSFGGGIRLPKPFKLSVKVVVLDEQDRILLLKRSMNSKGNPGKWDFPGGKVDSGEAFEEALLREVSEETGLKVLLQRVLATAESESPRARVVYIIMEGHIESGQVSLSHEHDDFAWVPRRDLAGMDMAVQFVDFIKKYSQGED
jgi:8-oxo-dGTP diphosphatase